MRIIRDVCPMTPVCIAKIGIKTQLAKLYVAFMREIQQFYSRKVVYLHEYAINIHDMQLERCYKGECDKRNIGQCGECCIAANEERGEHNRRYYNRNGE